MRYLSWLAAAWLVCACAAEGDGGRPGTGADCRGAGCAPATVRAMPAPAPTSGRPQPITGCDPGGCRDSAGNRYNGWGPGMIRSDGKLCQQVGNTMRCD